MPEPTEHPKTYVAFAGSSLLLSAGLEAMLRHVKQAVEREPNRTILIFEESAGKQVDFNLQGSLAEVLARALPSETKAKAGPGRPRLGVFSREVSLLPRHWDWLEQQPNGASAALRRMVDAARKHEPQRGEARQIRESVGKIMWALAGDYPNFEEASRALYAGDLGRFRKQTVAWSKEIRNYFIRRLQAADKLELGPDDAHVA